MSEIVNRVNLSVGDQYHAVLKVLAAARGRGFTLTDLVHELLQEALREEFSRDPGLARLVRELVVRDESADRNLRDRSLALLDKLIPETVEATG